MEPIEQTKNPFYSFILGATMAFTGGYLLFNQITVTGGSWHIMGYSGFGISLIPLIFGITIVFFNSRSVIGWIITGMSILAMIIGIITHLEIYYHPTSLWNTLIIVVLLAGGIGLLLRSLKK